MILLLLQWLVDLSGVYSGRTKVVLFILMILMREGDTPEGASPKGLGWPLHREKKKNEMKAGNPSQTPKIGQY